MDGSQVVPHLVPEGAVAGAFQPQVRPRRRSPSTEASRAVIGIDHDVVLILLNGEAHAPGRLFGIVDQLRGAAARRLRHHLFVIRTRARQHDHRRDRAEEVELPERTLVEVIVQPLQVIPGLGLRLHDLPVVGENAAHVENGAVTLARSCRHTTAGQARAARAALRCRAFLLQQALALGHHVPAVAVVADDVAFLRGRRFLRDRWIRALLSFLHGRGDARHRAHLIDLGIRRRNLAHLQHTQRILAHGQVTIHGHAMQRHILPQRRLRTTAIGVRSVDFPFNARLPLHRRHPLFRSRHRQRFQVPSPTNPLLNPRQHKRRQLLPHHHRHRFFESTLRIALNEVRHPQALRLGKLKAFRFKPQLVIGTSLQIAPQPSRQRTRLTAWLEPRFRPRSRRANRRLHHRGLTDGLHRRHSDRALGAGHGLADRTPPMNRRLPADQHSQHHHHLEPGSTRRFE